MAIFFPYFELAASLLVLVFSYHIWTRHYENKTARFYARFALAVFLACILSYSLRIAFTLELASFINRLSATVIAFSFSIFAHFALIFTRRDNPKNRWELPALYIPPALLGGLFLFTNLMFKRFEIFSYGIAHIPAEFYWLFVVQNIFYGGWGIILFFSYAKTAPQHTERAQARLIATGSTLALAIGLVNDELLPLLLGSRYTFPTLVFDFALMTFFIYLAMRKYSLFAISPCLAAKTIIETIPDSLIITDLEGRVLFLNEDAHKFFRVPKEAIIGKKIVTLFEHPERYKKLYMEVVDKKLEIQNYAETLLNPLGERHPSLISANLARGELGDIVGVVYVIREARG